MLQIQCLPYRVAYHVVGVLDYTEGRQRFIKLYEALPREKENYMIRHNSIKNSNNSGTSVQKMQCITNSISS